MEHLEPCPFCTGTRIQTHMSDVGVGYWMKCIDCKAEGPTGLDRDAAVGLWNMRSADETEVDQ